MNWNLSPEEFDRLPQRYLTIWTRINNEEKRKREVNTPQDG